jgi:glycosyltransferase involved in cell wall biosynthesis
MQARVAIIQNRVILGGRLSVILSIVEHLNQRGIRPDLICGGAPDAAVIGDRYGRRARFEVIRLPAPPLPTDLDVAQFNRRVGRRLDGYDLVINTSNSLAFLRQDVAPVIHWVFYPRKRRAASPAANIHQPEVRLGAADPRRLAKAFHRRLYRDEGIAEGTRVVAISKFVRDAIVADFDLPAERLAIVYPPVDGARFDASRPRRERVITLGRFQPYKRQLEQLEIARRLPELDFSIVGFVTSRRYFARCRRYRERHRVDNAELVAGASFDDTRALLEGSRFFLHSVRDEPFGLTTAEAILAGCVPVVHDSGGQREVVPDEKLRFATPAVAADRLRRLADAESLTGLNETLRRRAVELFSRQSFERDFGRLLDRTL